MDKGGCYNTKGKTFLALSHLTFGEGTGEVLLPGKSHGRRSLVGCSPWGHTELDTTEVT